MDLKKIEDQIRKCTRCPLWKHRLQALPGTGELGAKYLIVLESPDEHADRVGEIFEGRQGKELLKLMKEQKVKKEEVYLSTLVKCSPHGLKVDNLEIEECSSYLNEQIKQLTNLKKIFVVSEKKNLKINSEFELIKSIKEIKF